MKLANPMKEPRLALPVPAGVDWRVNMLGQTLQEATIAPDVTLRVRALVVPSIEYTEWLQGIMLEDAPVGTTLKPINVQSMTSPNGLPLVYAHHELLDAAGARIEERIGAFYAVVHNRAEVVVRIRGSATWSDHETVLRPYILSGTIEWPEYEDDLLATQLGLTL
jgi:hypothetical protein